MFLRVTRAADVSNLSDQRRWRIVLDRDRRYDGAFVYAVRSTGIYCRPTCPSKRPRHEQVRFFLVPEIAERAGFRPCRRCRPAQTNDADPRVETVRRACQVTRRTYTSSHPGMTGIDREFLPIPSVRPVGGPYAHESVFRTEQFLKLADGAPRADPPCAGPGSAPPK